MASRLNTRKRQSLSLPSRQLSHSRQHSLSDQHVVGHHGQVSGHHGPGGGVGQGDVRKSREARRRSSSEISESKQKTRTISVPVGLKEILNELSKEVS